MIRITPKPVLPIKLKIKPILPPAPVTERVSPPISYPMMHPKKKIAHMEHQHNGSSAGPREPDSPPAVSSTTSDLNCDGMAASPAPPPPALRLNGACSGSVSPSPSSCSSAPGGGREAVREDSAPVSAREGSTPGRREGSTPVPGREGGTPVGGREGGTPVAGKKGGREARTRCDVCTGEGSNANLVR